MRNQNDSFLEILSEAYEKGENEQGMTVVCMKRFINKIEVYVKEF